MAQVDDKGAKRSKRGKDYKKTTNFNDSTMAYYGYVFVFVKNGAVKN
ncbi:MAG TPA: hypothetical protein PLZ38_03040 [Spirochaetota bacterium]|nr:hypothetical protein [Spirochaetota bacterium]HOR92930.1 hypothetical protein [Spirochaetota bacterium]HPK45137.1 hypothetical protein [Spirochaetota bacterium]HQL42971.1 hypothetical protein [Spirochaetota bacterium]